MSLKAGVVQFSPLYGHVEENLDHLEHLVEEGVRLGAKILVLPEMAWTGYLWPNPEAIRPYAETAGFGFGQARVGEWSRRLDVTLVYGFPETIGTRLFNSQGIAVPDGRVHRVYRKTHLFEADWWWAESGDSGYLQWPSPWGPVGSGLCMDLNFPDLPDFHASSGTTILAFSTNWLDQDFDVVPYWEEKLLGAEGPGFRGVALFANRGGEEYGVAFRGQSSIFLEGKCIATLSGKEDGILVVEIES